MHVSCKKNCLFTSRADSIQIELKMSNHSNDNNNYNNSFFVRPSVFSSALVKDLLEFGIFGNGVAPICSKNHTFS